jgi:hypothetical protein
MKVFSFIFRLAVRMITAGADPSVAQDPAVSAENCVVKDEFSRAVWIAEAWGRREALAPYLAAQRLAWWDRARLLILETGLCHDPVQLANDVPAARIPVLSTVATSVATVVDFPDGWTTEARRQWQVHQEFATAENRR